jgi:hypothetical protein
VFSPTPIYQRLVAERGDVPAQVRSEAERIQRDLAQIIQTPLVGGLPPHRLLPDGNRPSGLL